MKRLYCLASAVVIGAFVAPAQARDGSSNCFDGDGEKFPRVIGHTSNGLACEVDWFDRHVDHGYNSFGQLCNLDPVEDLLVNCPLHRTELSSPDGLTCVSATMIHQNGAQPLGQPPLCDLGMAKRYQCRIFAHDQTGVAGWWWGYNNPDQDMIHAWGGLWELDWRAKIFLSHVTDDSRHNGGAYTLSCVLPAATSSQCGNGTTCLSLLKWFEAEKGEQ